MRMILYSCFLTVTLVLHPSISMLPVTHIYSFMRELVA
jgi:hypothetical protein